MGLAHPLTAGRSSPPLPPPYSLQALEALRKAEALVIPEDKRAVLSGASVYVVGDRPVVFTSNQKVLSLFKAYDRCLLRWEIAIQTALENNSSVHLRIGSMYK